MILVDTNVLLDVFQNDPEWAARSQEQLDAASATDRLVINPVIYSELFLAYRPGRSIKRGVLPDFYIGAQAAVFRCPLLTRDVARYRRYFPGISLMCP